MRKWCICAMLLSLAVLLPAVDGGGGKKSKGDDDEVKEGLQALQEFIGGWKNGSATHKTLGAWNNEKTSWSWRFKGSDRWMSFALENSKLYKGGEVRYNPSKSKYQITMIDKADKKTVYEGEMKKNVLTVERVDPDSNDTQQIRLNLAGGGDRLVCTAWLKPEGRTQYSKQFDVSYTREGVTFGVESGGKKPVCCVTGGLGTIAVSFGGATYYVCCSGCRDAFNENPKKVVEEFLKKKK